MECYDMPLAKNQRPRIIITLILLVAFLFILWVFVQYMIMPNLPPAWQTSTVWFGAAILAALAALGSVAQITGYSLRDLITSRSLRPPLPPLEEEKKDASNEDQGTSTEGSSHGYVEVTIVSPDGGRYCVKVDVGASVNQLLADIVEELGLPSDVEYSLALVGGTQVGGTRVTNGSVLMIYDKRRPIGDVWNGQINN
jgi:hypothetical protein